jgi:hypothetical protein
MKKKKAWTCTEGVFGALARQPGYALELQCACLMSMGRLPARLPGCISVPSAWLQGNAPPIIFLGHGRARLLSGDFGVIRGDGGWLAREV